MKFSTHPRMPGRERDDVRGYLRRLSPGDREAHPSSFFILANTNAASAAGVKISARNFGRDRRIPSPMRSAMRGIRAKGRVG